MTADPAQDTLTRAGAPHPAPAVKAGSRLIVYGDFNCPRSYLASQRVDTLLSLGHADIEWRAVEHDPRLSMTGTPRTANPMRWQRDLAETSALALPAERTPAAAPPLISNTLAAVSAYAEAVTDGVQHELRRALFEAIWTRRHHLSGADDVRRVITAITYRPRPVRPYLGLELPPPGLGHPDPFHMIRVLGGTIAANGIPLTTTGWRRAQRWRQDWLALTQHVVPTVIDPTGTPMPGRRALLYLAELLTGPQAEDAPTGTRRPVATLAPAA